jgi:hypothetical protein
MLSQVLQNVPRNECYWRAITAFWPPEVRERWEERVAIMRFDGGLTWEQAERRAFEDVITQVLKAGGWTGILSEG